MQRSVASAFMLAFSYLSLFALLNLFFALAAFYGGRLNFDTNIATLSALWVGVVVLRANFPPWTSGWWISEFLLYGAVAACIIYLLRAYVHEVNIKTDLEERLAVRQALFAPELLSKIKGVADYIEVLGTEKSDDARLELVSRALSDVSRAEAIAETIDAILAADHTPALNLEPMDVVDLMRSVVTAESLGCTPSFDPAVPECMVVSSRLLADAINRVLTLIVHRVGPIAAITIAAARTDIIGTAMCEVHMAMQIETDNAREKREMLMRYAGNTALEAAELAYARRLVSLIRGTIGFSFEVEDITHLSIEISFLLPAICTDRDD